MSNKERFQVNVNQSKQVAKTAVKLEKGEKKKKVKNKRSSQKSTSKGQKSTSKGSSFLAFVKSDTFKVLNGLFLLIFTFFLLLSFISFLGTHDADDSLFNTNLFQINADGRVKNMLGVLGMYFSFLFIKKWFGIAAFGVLLLFFLYAVRLMFKVSILPLFKTTVITIAIIIWVSLFSATINIAEWSSGEICQDVFLYLEQKIGFIGVILLLLFYASAILIILGGWQLLIKNKKSTCEDIDEEIPEQTNKTTSDLTLPEETIEKPQLSQPSIWSKLFRKKKKQINLEEEKTEEPSLKEENIASLKEKEDINNEEISIDERLTFSVTTVELPKENILEEYPENDTFGGQDVLLDDTEEEILSQETTDEQIMFNEVVDIPTEETEEEQNVDKESLEPIEYTREELTTAEDLCARFGPFDPRAELPNFQFPSSDFLEDYANVTRTKEEKIAEIAKNKQRIKDTLETYKIQISSISAIEGPTITLYEIVPAPGIRISKIKNLEDDIALSLSALGIRIIAPIPGKGTIGIEVPNTTPQIVPMKTCILSEKFQNSEKMALPIAIGKTISDEVFVFDLAKMPHVLMAGATGQGKSVGLNAVLTSLLYKKHPAELKFVLVDPKKVELTLYARIERHYLAKLPDSAEAIITDTKKVVKTLNSLCNEMDMRYELLKSAECRNIIEYNEKFKKRCLNPENGHRFLPYIVLVFDEFADCIMTAGREVEQPIARLAQLARAIGIHLIIATQRPSVNIITGIIKANFPARIAFKVSSKIDSRTILDATGANNLIGRGDMLISTGSNITRVQCALVDTPEVEKICAFIGEQHGYTDAFLLPEVADDASETTIQQADDGEFDPLFDDAAREVVEKQQGSTSFLQRKFKIGYNRAGRIMDQLEREGIVGPSIGSKVREVRIINIQDLEELLKIKNGN